MSLETRYDCGVSLAKPFLVPLVSTRRTILYIVRLDSFGVLQERISERSQGIEVPKISCLGSAEIVKSVPHQERISERMGRQRWIIEVPKIACQESAEVVKTTPQERSPERICEQRTVEQSLDDTWPESFSRFRERRQLGQGEKEKDPSFLVTM